MSYADAYATAFDVVTDGEEPPVDAFTQARRDIADALTATGLVNVSLDPRLQPPGILVDAPSRIRTGNGGATWEAMFPVRVLTPPPGDAMALDHLLVRLDPVLQALGATAEALAGTYPLNDKDCPAYTVEITRTLVVPNC